MCLTPNPLTPGAVYLLGRFLLPTVFQHGALDQEVSQGGGVGVAKQSLVHLHRVVHEGQSLAGVQARLGLQKL